MADKKTKKNVRRAVKQKGGAQQYSSPRVLKDPAKVFNSYGDATSKAYGKTSVKNPGKINARAFKSASGTSASMKVFQKKRGK